MCYSYKVVWTADKAKHFKVPPKHFQELSHQGKIQKQGDEFIFFPKNQVPVVLNGRDGQPLLTPMHWDLLPRWYQGAPSDQVDLLQGHQLSLEQVLRDKDSRAQIEGKTVGFSSYNARMESIESKPTYQKSWQEGRRCLLPADAFWERPNMKEAPVELQGNSFELAIEGEYALAGVYDVWEGPSYTASGEGSVVKFPSVSVLTTTGLEHPTMQKVYHDRAPVLIPAQNYAKWLSSDLSPQEAQEMALCLGDFTLKTEAS